MRFSLSILDAGMEPYEGFRLGALRGITREILAKRERMVSDWFKRNAVPVAFVLAGGYLGSGLDREWLVALHRLTIEAA